MQDRDRQTNRFSRRRFLALGIAAPAFVAACSDDEPRPSSAPTAAESPTPGRQSSPAAQLAPTPSCADDDEPTLAQTEGPYFTPNSPERTSLIESGVAGVRLALAGQVLSTTCQPVARALVDFWQCDAAGVYDNVGYRLRGHQFTDAQGRYNLTTIVPGVYPGRTRHIHVKVQAPNRPVLTTQLYFPNEPGNRSDGIFNNDLVVDIRDGADGKDASFDFVLRV